MTEPDELGWRVRVGGGLVEHAPLSAERRAIVDRDAEKERAQAARDAEVRESDAAERRGELLIQGRVPRSHGELLEQVGFWQDRADAVEAQRERKAAEQLGEPVPGRLDRYQLKREHAEREEAKQTTPATQAEVGKLEQQITNLKGIIHSATGRKPY